MYPAGLLSLVQAVVADPSEAAIKLSIALPSIVFLLFLWSRSSSKQDLEDSPTTLPEGCLLTIFPFFRSRFDFLNWGFKLSGQAIFQFRLLQVKYLLSLSPIPPGSCSLSEIFSANIRTFSQNTVIAVSGEPGRRDFFTSKGLDINEGFKVLSGAVSTISITPSVPGR